MCLSCQGPQENKQSLEQGGAPTLRNVTANASGPGVYVFGLYNIGSGNAIKVDVSSFSATGGGSDNKAMRNDSASYTIQVGFSKISGTAGGLGLPLRCIYCYSGTYAPLSGTCQ